MVASLPEFADLLDPTDRLSEVFPTQPSTKHVQIIVRVTGMQAFQLICSISHDIPGPVGMPCHTIVLFASLAIYCSLSFRHCHICPLLSRKEEAQGLKYVMEYSVVFLLTIHFSDDFRDIVERWQSKRLKTRIPSIAELKAFVDKPLLDNEKIPLDPERFQSVINMTTPGGDWCSREDVESLFCSEEGHSVLDQFFFVVSEAPPRSGTESSFHSFWDANLRKILGPLLPGGWSMRDSSRHTATGSLRPAFAFILSKLCTFRGRRNHPGVPIIQKQNS